MRSVGGILVMTPHLLVETVLVESARVAKEKLETVNASVVLENIPQIDFNPLYTE